MKKQTFFILAVLTLALLATMGQTAVTAAATDEAASTALRDDASALDGTGSVEWDYDVAALSAYCSSP